MPSASQRINMTHEHDRAIQAHQMSPALRSRVNSNFSRLVRTLISITGLLGLFTLGLPFPFNDGFAQEQTPAPFDPAETQHGFADFDTIPTIPSDNTPPEKLPYYDPSHQPASIHEVPKGLFQEITLAEDVDEDLALRRGHVYLPVRPTDRFTTDHPAIYVVFRVFKHYAPYQIFAQLYPQHNPESQKPGMLDEDIVYLALEDESGYLKLFPPDGGWQPGAYQVHIFVGFQANAVTRMGTLHFTILKPS